MGSKWEHTCLHVARCLSSHGHLGSILGLELGWRVRDCCGGHCFYGLLHELCQRLDGHAGKRKSDEHRAKMCWGILQAASEA